jgi:galactosyl transferase GMA12/MNN10 family
MLTHLLVFLVFTKINFPLAQISLAPRDQPGTLNLEHVANCCPSSIRDSSLELLECVTDATENAELYKKWLADHGTPRIGLISYATEDVANYAAYSFGINQAYSEQNGYMFRLADPETDYEPRDVRWNKVQIVLHALRTWAKTADYLVWLDADLIFLDMGLKLELVVKNFPDAHMWVSTPV